MDFNILIGGSAGQGIETLSQLLEKLLQRSGYNLFSNKDYMSRVRGGHNFTQIRFGNGEYSCHKDKLDMIIAFDETSIESHMDDLLEDGLIVFDSKYSEEEKIKIDRERALDLDLEKVAKDSGNIKALNTVFFGVITRLFDLDVELAGEIIGEVFPEKIEELNRKAFDGGYNLTDRSLEIDRPKRTEKRIMINSNQAIALGAMASGLTFYTAYPMTPSTSIMNFIAKNQRQAKIVVEQAEDEIGAINMAIGASYAGVRTMTATSGGGFSLMTESLGLAGMTETPLVLANVQRPGPATGFPTRTEQSDLSFILTASHGEIPRFIMSIRSPEEAFYKTARAFNIAEKYQTLVIILNDQYLADANKTIEPYDFDRISIERNIDYGSSIEDSEYNRYSLEGGSISPRIIPGTIWGKTSLADSDEHDEHGNITESAEVRVSMMKKRMEKMTLLESELEEPNYLGADKPDILFLGWGSTQGPIEEAIGQLVGEGLSVGSLCFGDIWPLPKKILLEKAEYASKVINIEQNYTGQLAKLIRQETGIAFDESILKYDGRQMSLDYILEEIRKVI